MDGCTLGLPPTHPRAGYLRCAGVEPRLTYRPGSRAGRPASRHGAQRGLAAAKACQPAGAFTLDERPKSFVDDSGALGDTGQALGFSDQVVVQVQGRAHIDAPDGYASNIHRMMPDMDASLDRVLYGSYDRNRWGLSTRNGLGKILQNKYRIQCYAT